MFDLLIQAQKSPSNLMEETSMTVRGSYQRISSIFDPPQHYMEESGALDIWRLKRSSQCRLRLLQISSDLKLRGSFVVSEREVADLLEELASGDEDGGLTAAFLNDKYAEQIMNLIYFILREGFWRCQRHQATRRRAHYLCMRLSEAYQLVPSSLRVTGVQLLEEEAIHGGGFAEIYRALYRNETVALKSLRVYATDKARRNVHRALCREALVLQYLEHPFVLPFLGLDRDTFVGSLCMVTPWMEHGTILDHLAANGPLIVDIDKRLLEIVQGLDYLHSQHIIHGDLRATNILIGEDWHVRIADFGLAAVAEAADNTLSASQGGSTRWMAPELFDWTSLGLQSFERTPATDIFAFACVCLEVYTMKPPFAEFPSDTAVMLKVVMGERPKHPQEISNSLWSLIERCWTQQPAKRPVIAKIIGILEKLCKDTRKVEPLPEDSGDVLSESIKEDRSVPSSIGKVDRRNRINGRKGIRRMSWSKWMWRKRRVS